MVEGLLSNVIVIGHRGLVGSDLMKLLQAKKIRHQGLGKSTIDLARATESQLIEALKEADVVINAAGFTDVDAAEMDPQTVLEINANAPARLAAACNKIEAKLVQLSSDYVFDGKYGIPIPSSAEGNPKTMYGLSKVLGENFVKDISNDFVIIRSAWLYSDQGACFPRSIASKINAGEKPRVVSDQFGQPTWVRDLSEKIVAYSMMPESKEVAHCVSSGFTSWYEFAQEIVSSLGLNSSEYVSPTSTSQADYLAPRPRWSVLENSETIGGPIGHWRERWQVAAPNVLREFI